MLVSAFPIVICRALGPLCQKAADGSGGYEEVEAEGLLRWALKAIVPTGSERSVRRPTYPGLF